MPKFGVGEMRIMKLRLNISGVLLLLVFVFLVGAAEAQVKTVDFKLKSDLMKREVPYRVLLPAKYEERKDARFPVVYLLHGLTGRFDNWTEKTKIAKILESHNLIVVMPEGENGWYTDSAVNPDSKYESYIMRELIPQVDRDLRTESSRNGRFIAGLSMGGYGALKFGMKYPQMFAVAGSFSGALGAAAWNDQLLGATGVISQSIMAAYGPKESEVRKENDIFVLAKNSTAETNKNLPFIYLDCGTEDFLIGNVRDFAGLLLEKKIPHEFRQRPGKHDWPYWESQVEEFFNLIGRHLRKDAESKQASN